MFNMFKRMGLINMVFFCASMQFANAEEKARASTEELPVKPIAVFFTGYRESNCGFEMAGRLAKDAFSVNAQGGRGLEGDALTWNVLKRYNVIVLMGLGRSNADFTLTDKNKNNIELLTRYLNEGGGILYIPTWCQDKVERPPQEAFAKSLGCEILFDEIIYDPDTAVNATAWKIDFAHTSNFLAESPLTKGINSLWYPSACRLGAQNHSTTASFNKDWTVVLKGSRTAGTRFIGDSSAVSANTGELNSAPIGKYEREAPIAACRSVGKGRIVYFAITPEYLFGNRAASTLEGIVMKEGLQKKASDGYVFIKNSLNWLAEPSINDDDFGGARPNLDLQKNAFKIETVKPYNWEKTTKTETYSVNAGLIGARTTFSSGNGSVEQWVNEAKKNGLKYLVFLEEFSALSPEKFNALKKECAQFTSKDFAAIPGFTIDDEVGNHYFYYGTSFPYPESKLLTTDGKRFASLDQELDPKNPRQPGQLNMTTLNYSLGYAGFKLTAGNYQIKDTAPFANFFANWDAFAVITSNQGKLIDDASVGHRQVAALGQGAIPIAIDFMTEPEQLAKSPWRTVLCLPASGASAVGDDLSEHKNEVASYWNTWHFYPDNPTRVFITSGPEIVNWGFSGPRDYEGGLPGDFIWQDMRWRICGEVKSDIGLKEVAIYDGEKLFRRFLPDGKNEFAFDIELNHDKQHALTLVVTDNKGQSAVGQEQWDRNHRLEEFNCSDRNNQLSYGYSTNKDGFGIQLGGNQPLATPNKRVDGREISPAATFKCDQLLGAPAFDGAAVGEPVFMAPAKIRRIDNSEIIAPTVCEPFRLLHSGDVNIGEGRYEHYFTDNIRVANVWHTLWRTEPASDFTLLKRNIFVNIDPDSPLAVFLWTMRLTLKKDMPNNGVHAGFIRTDEAKFWALRGSDASFRSGLWETSNKSLKRSISVPFELNAYAAMLGAPLGGMAVFPLSQGLKADLALPEQQFSNINFFLSAEHSPQKAEESAEVSFLLLGIPRATTYTKQLSNSTTETVERFYRDFGLDGGKTGYKITADTGEIIGQRYVLEINGQAEKCFSGIIEGDIISSLPIMVSGLNDNWTSFLFDRTLKKARPIGMLEDKAWARLLLHGKLNVFAGHPISCDQEEVILTLVQSDESSWSLELHNPTDKAIKTILKKNPFFDPLKDKLIQIEPIDLPAGQSITIKL